MKGLGTNEDALIDALVYSTPTEIQEIKVAYAKKYGLTPQDANKLENDIIDDTSGDFKRVLLELLKVDYFLFYKSC